MLAHKTPPKCPVCGLHFCICPDKNTRPSREPAQEGVPARPSARS
ncbi:hypothetical protein SAMN04489718_3835 [Actinopolyspora saharensis]|uniref:Uncharacterized protein n=1 Tax=Actinopolyspora saharensis TaxID=995062 RepID=A0A1H1GS65_9ACTN|nr:hypothetical protein SAMN04489718_3835 [Actinopolyspora saharensis]